MATIIGGIGISHVPSIGAALDNGKLDTEPWQRIYAGYQPARDWLTERRPDAAVVVYNDHGAAFSLDALPTFAIGTAESYSPADEGYGRRPIATIDGDPLLSWHIVEALVNGSFDVTICQRLDVDHGLTVPLTSLWGRPAAWPVRVIPLAVNVVQLPTPTPARCLLLGEAIGAAIAAYEPGLRVVVVGTGGMSHQLQGPRAGHINEPFDRMFLAEIGRNPAALARLSTAEYIRAAGSEGAELIMWLVMRGALGADQAVSVIHQDYYVPASNTAAGVIVLEH